MKIRTEICAALLVGAALIVGSFIFSAKPQTLATMNDGLSIWGSIKTPEQTPYPQVQLDSTAQPDIIAEPYRFNLAPLQPKFFIIRGKNGEMLVQISLEDGKITYGENYQPDEAAVTLWQALGRHATECHQ